MTAQEAEEMERVANEEPTFWVCVRRRWFSAGAVVFWSVGAVAWAVTGDYLAALLSLVLAAYGSLSFLQSMALDYAKSLIACQRLLLAEYERDAA